MIRWFRRKASDVPGKPSENLTQSRSRQAARTAGRVWRVFLHRTIPGRTVLRFLFLIRTHRTWSLVGSGALLLLVLVQIFFAIRRTKPVDTGALVPDVRTIEIRHQTLRQEVKAPGTITFLEKAAVTSKVQGRMAQVLVDIGDVVQKGARLGSLETFEIMLKLKQTEASVQSSLSQVHLADARYQNARREIDRQIAGLERAQSDIVSSKAGFITSRQNLMNKKELYDIGGVSESQLKTTYTEYLSSMTRYYQTRKDYEARIIGFRNEDLTLAGMQVPEAPAAKRDAFVNFNTEVDKRQVEVARAAYNSALAELDSARLILKESTIISPLSGTVASRAIEIGEEIKQGEPVFTVVRMDRLLVSTGVPEDVLRSVKIGQPVELSVDAYDGQIFPGTVYKVAPVIDVKTRTAEVKIEVDNKEKKLNPGMFCRVSILTRTKEKGIAVPVSAVLNRKEGEKGQITGEVFVVQKGLAFKKPVILGETFGAKLEIVTGLAEGDEVAVDRTESLKDGGPVRARKEGNLPTEETHPRSTMEQALKKEPSVPRKEK